MGLIEFGVGGSKLKQERKKGTYQFSNYCISEVRESDNRNKKLEIAKKIKRENEKIKKENEERKKFISDNFGNGIDPLEVKKEILVENGAKQEAAEIFKHYI